jgi:hypothetical protein
MAHSKNNDKIFFKNYIPMFKEFQVKWFILNLKQCQELTFDHACTCVFVGITLDASQPTIIEYPHKAF